MLCSVRSGILCFVLFRWVQLRYVRFYKPSCVALRSVVLRSVTVGSDEFSSVKLCFAKTYLLIAKERR